MKMFNINRHHQNQRPVRMVILTHHRIRIRTMGKENDESRCEIDLFFFSDNIPLNLSTKQYSSPSSSSIPSNNAKAFLNYPFASLLSLASQSSNIVPSYESSSIYSASSSPMKDYPSYNRRQRERTTFDPHEETPRLLQIFTDTKHPTRYQIASICESLNALPCRKGGRSLLLLALPSSWLVRFREKSLGTLQYSILV